MPAQPLSFLARLWLAIVCWFRIVFDPPFAQQIAAVREQALLAAGAPAPAPAPPRDRPTLPATPTAINTQQLARCEEALHLTAMLQREGRLLDFVEEDLTGFSDAQIGAAARTVHDGCKKALHQAFTFAPVRLEKEGAPVSLPGGFDPGAVRLTGNVVGNPPFNGVLRHHGWKVTDVHMPTASGDPTLVAPAEVELP